MKTAALLRDLPEKLKRLRIGSPHLVHHEVKGLGRVFLKVEIFRPCKAPLQWEAVKAAKPLGGIFIGAAHAASIEIGPCPFIAI